MKLKFIETDKRWIIGLGVFSPWWTDEVEDELGKKLLKTGHFEEIKKIKRKKVERKIKQKSKKKGVKNNEHTKTRRNQKRGYLGNQSGRG